MIRVAIYEDNVGLRDILASIIRDSDGFELAGEFGHCMDVVKNTEAYTPQVIIMDIDMPGKSGIEGVAECKAAFPDVEIIMNTVFDDDDRIFQAIQAGATGYLLKKNSLATLLDSIREVKQGGAPMSPSIARKVLSMPFAKAPAAENVASSLSAREMEILSLLSKGYSYKMIATDIHLSIDTIRTHIKKIYQKLQVHSVTEAIHKVYINK